MRYSTPQEAAHKRGDHQIILDDYAIILVRVDNDVMDYEYVREMRGLTKQSEGHGALSTYIIGVNMIVACTRSIRLTRPPIITVQDTF